MVDEPQQGRGGLAADQLALLLSLLSIWVMIKWSAFSLGFSSFGTEGGHLSHDSILKPSVRFQVSKCYSSIHITKYIIFQCMCNRNKAQQTPS